MCATVTLLIINPAQFTPEFIYTIIYLFSAVGWFALVVGGAADTIPSNKF